MQLGPNPSTHRRQCWRTGFHPTRPADRRKANDGFGAILAVRVHSANDRSRTVSGTLFGKVTRFRSAPLQSVRTTDFDRKAVTIAARLARSNRR